MKYYTEIVPFELAVKLKANGFNMPTKMVYKEGIQKEAARSDDWNSMDCYFDYASAPTYAEVLDWLMEKGLNTMIVPNHDVDDWFVDLYLKGESKGFSRGSTFHEATNAAIEKALEVLAEQD